MKRSIITLFVSCFAWGVFAQQVQVILRVASADQHDTLGFNIVENITSEVYGLLMNQQVRLWDGPEKEIHINASSLKQIESSSGTSFVNQEVIYIYENWEKTKAGVNSQTIGFKFAGKNEKGEEVSYGFVDFADVRNHFLKIRMKVNANGNYETTFAYALLKKNFNFNLLQFGSRTVTAGGVSREIISDFVGKSSFNPTLSLQDSREKKIDYVIEFSKTAQSSKAIAANQLLAGIETFLQNNEEFFFNLGGDRIINHIKKGKIKVTKLEVTEFWKNFRGQISIETKHLTVFVNDSALQRMDFNDFLLLGIQTGDKSMYETFKEREFAFTIRNINDAAIPRKDAHLYLKALETYDWSKLTEFVKYY
ncbi:MAG: hypothetical protein JNL47_01335 [Bacteroidia bacterium]|nr:hypothetical protein [Bacteroidia bacterium]